MSEMSFAGEPCLLYQQEISDFLIDNLNLDITYWFGGYAPATYNSRLPVVNYPPSPRVRLNTLYWPSGATRWAYTLVLVDGPNLVRIMAACQPPVPTGEVYRLQPAYFVLDDGEHRIQFEMYPLTPKRINCPGLDNEVNGKPVKVVPAGKEDWLEPNSLWMLPIVDVRYFWQWCGTDLSIYAESWRDLITRGLVDSLRRVPGEKREEEDPKLLQFIQTSNISSVYVTPDVDSFSFDPAEPINAAVQLDAAASSIGMRVIRDYDPNAIVANGKEIAYLMDSGDALIRFKYNMANAPDMLAGWFNPGGGFKDDLGIADPITGAVLLSPSIPSNVDFYSVTGTKRSFSSPLNIPSYGTFRGSQKIHSTYDLRDGNAAQFNLLADRWGRDFYKFRRVQYDMVFPGIQPWQPCGFDDFVLFEYGTYNREGFFKCQTRVVSMPPSVAVNKQLSRGTRGVEVRVFLSRAVNGDEPVIPTPLWYSNGPLAGIGDPPPPLGNGDPLRDWASGEAVTNASGLTRTLMMTVAYRLGVPAVKGFAIPAGSTILSIKVRIYRRSAGGSVTDNSVRLTKDGTTPVGDNQAIIAIPWGTAGGLGILGTPSDYGDGNPLWGENWTADEINADTFGVILQARSVGASVAFVGRVEIRVSYQPAVP